jgi:hypothetical protein
MKNFNVLSFVFVSLFLLVSSVSAAVDTSVDYFSLNSSEESLQVRAPGVLNNDLSKPNITDVYLVSNETLHGAIYFFNDLISGGLGSFTYATIFTNFSGVDYFDYIANDGVNNSTTTRVWLGINNSVPLVYGESYSLPLANGSLQVGAPGLLNNLDGDPDGDTVYFYITNEPHKGNLSNLHIGGMGAFTYATTLTNASGVDYFDYLLSDGYSNSTSARAIIVIGNNSNPVAMNDTYSTSLGELNVSASAGVKANDVDADGDYLFVELVNTTVNGSLNLDSDGSFIYTPNTSFIGTDSFTYYITDLDKNSSTVTVTIYVNTTVVNNVTDDADNETTSGDNVTVNVSSEVYPLLLNFQLYNGNVLVNESNFTANSSLDLPTNYSVPTGLAAGNYTLNLSLYSSTNELLNKTTLAEFEIKSTGGSGDNNDGNTGGGGGSSRRTVTNQTNVTVNATIPTTSNTTVANQTNSTVSEVEEEQPSRFSTITGNVIGTTTGRVSLGILVFLILVGLAYWFVAKKRKAANSSVKVVKMSALKKKK